MRATIAPADIAPVQRYTRVAIGLHWTIAALVIVNLPIGLLHDAFEDMPLIPLHKSIGITVLALVLLHVAAALKHHLIDRDSVLIRIAPALGRR